MANENKNINELVSDDDDPTAELEILSFQEFDLADVEPESEVNTYGFGTGDHSSSGQSIPELRSDLQTRTETIGRLQYDIEQLRAKWLGLETEIEAREEIVNALLRDVDGLKDELSRKDKLLKKRNRSIKSLKSEVRQRDEIHRLLQQQYAELEQKLVSLRSTDEDKVSALDEAKHELDEARSELEGQLASTAGALAEKENELQEMQSRLLTIQKQGADKEVLTQQASLAAVKEAKTQLAKAEEYADTLRYKLQDFAESQFRWSQERETLSNSVEELSERNWSLSEKLNSADASLIELQAALQQQHADHEQEIRLLRFELNEAQDTVAQTGEINAN